MGTFQSKSKTFLLYKKFNVEIFALKKNKNQKNQYKYYISIIYF